MYKKIYGPYPKKGLHQLTLVLLDGTKQSKAFSAEQEALDFIRDNQPRTVAEPITMKQAVKQYVDSRADLRQSTRTTMKFRLEKFIRGREDRFVQGFPAMQVWTEMTKDKTAVDTLYGIRSAAQGLFSWCVQRGWLKKNPLADVEITGKKKRGKPQLRIDEARAFLLKAFATAQGSSVESQQHVAVVGAATALLLGLRSSEVVLRQVRDLDDDGRVFCVPESKTEAGVRSVEVPDVLQPFLLKLAHGKVPTDRLFAGLTKDGLRYWTEWLCKEAGVPRVTPHGLRGTNATASLRANTNPHVVAAALGHTNIGITLRHYADVDEVAAARNRTAVANLTRSESRSETRSENFRPDPENEKSPTSLPGHLSNIAS